MMRTSLFIKEDMEAGSILDGQMKWNLEITLYHARWLPFVFHMSMLNEDISIPDALRSCGEWWVQQVIGGQAGPFFRPLSL